MQFINLTRHRAFKLFRNSVLFLLLLVVVFAPLQPIFTTPIISVAHAQATPPVPTTAPTTTTVPNTGTPAAGKEVGFCINGDVSTCLTGIVYLFAVYLPTFFAYITGYFFNFGVQLSLNSTSYALNFVSEGWTVVRDIANLAFIFILIYIAYIIIIGAETTGTMHMLASVVVMALLINFSFFITRVVIDAGNILAVQFYNAISIQGPGSTAGSATPIMASPLKGVGTNSPAVKDLTAGIMNVLNIQGLLGTDSFQKWINRSQAGGTGEKIGTFFVNVGVLTLIFIAVGIFLAIIGFIFLMMGVKFLIRVIVLWFAIIASPLAFVAYAVPNKEISKYGALWRRHLTESALYPAVFMFLFFILTLFMNALAGQNGIIPTIFDAGANGGGVTGAGTIPGFVSIIANVGIRVGLVTLLLYYAMQFSDKFSEMGGSAAGSAVSWASNKTAGVSGWALRNTAGRGANRLASNKYVQRFAANSVAGRPVMAALRGVAGSSLDVRGVAGLRTVAGKGGVHLDHAPHTSFDQKVAERAQNVVARAEQLKVDPLTLERARRNNEKTYDTKNGKGAYKIKEAQLEKDKIDAKKDQIAAAADKKTAVAAKDSNAIRVAVESHNVATEKIKEAEKEMAGIKSFGKDKLITLQKERLQRFENRIGDRNFRNAWSPSAGSVLGAGKVHGMIAGEKGHTPSGGGGGSTGPGPHPLTREAMEKTKASLEGRSLKGHDDATMKEMLKVLKGIRETGDAQYHAQRDGNDATRRLAEAAKRGGEERGPLGGYVATDSAQRPQRSSEGMRGNTSEQGRSQRRPFNSRATPPPPKTDEGGESGDSTGQT